jgi:Amt family ammonium transporter
LGIRSRRSLLWVTTLALVAVTFAVPGVAHAADGGPSALDQGWVLVSAALIFFMQAGFLALEAGLVRPQNAAITALKSVVDFTVVCIAWVAIGYAFSFGETAGGVLGTSLWFGDGVRDHGMGWIFVLFQMGFAATSVTIVSGAMAERVGFHTYVIISCVNGALIYPVVAHWVWGNALFDQDTLLSGIGFYDFAGSTVVHSVGGWISLVGIWMLGPRIGRFDDEGKPRPIALASMPIAATGAFILWFGWWGFNGGSTLEAGQPAAEVIVNTSLAGSAAALVAWAHARLVAPRRDVELKFLGGALCGLVAVTASANIIGPASALLIGALAGLVHNLVYELLLRLRLDDPVGAVPVHLGGGVLGTLCVALFGENLPRSRVEQLGVQALGIGAVAILCVALTFVTLWILSRTIGLRVAPRDENDGVTLSPGGAAEHAPHQLDEAELRRLMGE